MYLLVVWAINSLFVYADRLSKFCCLIFSLKIIHPVFHVSLFGDFEDNGMR